MSDTEKTFCFFVRFAAKSINTETYMAKELNEQQPRPNRDAYSKMFVEDNPDIDFEDKEARYGRMAEERESYRSLQKSSRGLTEALDKNRWLGAMFQDLAQNPDKDPVSWMYDNGIDVQRAMEDEEYRRQAAEGLVKWQQKQAAGEAAAKQKDDNLQASAEALDALSQELNISDEQCSRMWKHLFEDVIVPGMNGEVSKDTWQMVLHAMNYDQDMKNARAEAGMQARNEKIQNRVKTFDESRVPPSFSQGSGQRTAPQRQKKESLLDFVRRNS